jgi:hypothetical protein
MSNYFVKALEEAIYEITHLSSAEEDGKYRPIIDRSKVDEWRKVLQDHEDMVKQLGWTLEKHQIMRDFESVVKRGKETVEKRVAIHKKSMKNFKHLK